MNKQQKIRLLTNNKKRVKLIDILSCGTNTTFYILKTVRNMTKNSWYFMDLEALFSFLSMCKYSEYYIYRAKTRGNSYKIKEQVL